MAKKKKTTATKKTTAPAKAPQTTSAEDDSLFQLLDSKIEIPLSTLRDKHIFYSNTLLWWATRRTIL